MYSDIYSSVNNNGWMTEFVNLKRGVRQGCPLSAQLFILCVEILACRIRQCKEIDGVQLPSQVEEKQARIAQLADDTTVFVRNEKSINRVLDIMSQFQKVSGLKINKDKTEAVWIGSLKDSKKVCGKLKWTTEPVKVLGVYVGYNKQKCDELNWQPKLEKLESTLNSWKMRNLTPHGKVLITKCLGLSNLLYLAAVLDVPPKVVKKVDKLVFDFIDCSKYKIKKGVLLSPIEKGGLSIPSFYELSLALKFTWFRKFFDENKATWKILFSYLLQPHYNESILKSCIDPNNLPHEISNVLSEFYIDCLKVWFNMKAKSKRDSKRTLLWNSLYRLFVPVVDQILHTFTLNEGSEEIDISKLTTKIVYKLLLDDFLMNTNAIQMWNRECKCIFNERNVWLLAKRVTPETKLHSFHWKFTIRRVPTNLRLYQWKKIEAPLCECCREVDTFRHRFWDCIVAQNIWKMTENILSDVIKSRVILEFENIIGGISLQTKKIENIVNFIILVGKWSIYKCYVCNIHSIFSSKTMFKNELYQRAQAQKIDILLRIVQDM